MAWGCVIILCMNYPIKSLLFLVGDDEFADSPARINRAMFANPDIKWMPLLKLPSSKYVVEYDPDVHMLHNGHRMIVAVRITRQDKTQFIQPFYRSSGRATPDLSPRGTWWPSSGLYTAAYCKWKGHDEDWAGFIGKHQFVSSKWRSHGKIVDNLHIAMKEIAARLSEVIAPIAK